MTTCLGCGKETESKLKCPQCIKLLNVHDNYFCSQECFKSVYSQHHQEWHVRKLEKRVRLTTGHESIAAGFKEDDMTTWRFDSRLRPFEQYKYIFVGPLRPWPTTAMRKVEDPEIKLPDYALTGKSLLEERRGATIVVYKGDELQRMRESCILGRQALDLAHSMCKVGMTPVEIDDAVHEFIVSHKAYPSPLNYYNFPKSCCISVNEIVCHGIPDLRPLQSGDIVNVDITVYYKGMHADLNETYAVGDDVDEKSLQLIKCAHDSLMEAIKICKPDVPYREIGRVIERFCKAQGFSVVRSYTGHGIGHLFHTVPNIPHYEANRAKGLMKEGHVFTIEPMVSMGVHGTDMWPDNWTVCTSDGKRSAQFEHQIVITSNGAEILTARLPDSPPLDL